MTQCAIGQAQFEAAVARFERQHRLVVVALQRADW